MTTGYTYDEISHISVEVGGQYDRYHNESPSFLQLLCTAWLKADPGNRLMMRTLMIALIDKYELSKYLNYRYGIDMKKRMVEECINEHRGPVKVTADELATIKSMYERMMTMQKTDKTPTKVEAEKARKEYDEYKASIHAKYGFKTEEVFGIFRTCDPRYNSEHDGEILLKNRLPDWLSCVDLVCDCADGEEKRS